MGMAIFVLHFLYLTGPYPWNVGNICFTFLLYVIALCVMYVCMYVCMYIYIYIYMFAHVWVIVHFVWLAMSAFDLMAWVCALVDCCRCIFVSYCVHGHRCVIVPILVTKWHQFPYVCITYQLAECFEGLWLILAQACWHVLYTQAQNLVGVI